MAEDEGKKKPRRLPGEGSISQEPGGSWKWRLGAGKTASGGQRRIVRRAQTITELEKKIKEVRAELSAGVNKTGGKLPTLAEWLHEWTEEIRSIAAAPKTLSGYRTDAGHINPVIGRIRLDKLTTRDVNRVYAAMVKKGLSPSTVAHCHRTLRAALNTAVKHRMIAWNPATAAELPALVEYEIDPLTRKESLAVLKAARRKRNSSRWRVALSLGLRQGEALALQLNDIDFENRRLSVKRQVQRIAWRHGCADKSKCTHIVRDKHGKEKTTRCRGVDCPQRQGPGGLLVRPTKGKQSRTVGIPESMIPELREQTEMLEADRKRARSLWKQGPGGGWLYPGALGQLQDPRRDYDQWCGLLEEAGVRRVRLHGARHTAATMLLGAGLDDRAVQETFGWRSGAMLQRYQHWNDEHREAVADVMDSLLGEQAGEQAGRGKTKRSSRRPRGSSGKESS